MNWWFFFKCFLVGVSVSTAIGPIFILTFNRGSIYGFWKGFVTALGSALADGCLFLLGSIGLLRLVGRSPRAVLAMDFIGGLAMIFFGIRLLRGNHNQKEIPETTIPLSASIVLTIGKSFFITLFNPLALLFFMFVSVQLVPEGLASLSLTRILAGSFMITLGSLTVLSVVAFGAHYIGKAINTQSLKAIAYVTGLVLVGIGCYFLVDLVRLGFIYYVPCR